MNIKYKDTFLRIIHTCDVNDCLEDGGDYIVASHWYVPSKSKQFISAEKLWNTVKSYKKAKFYMMANSEQEYDNYIKYFDKHYVFFCSRHFNHGLKPDGSRIFSPKDIGKKYDFIFNGGHNKQQEKLKYLDNLCILSKYSEKPKVKCNYYNEVKLSLQEVDSFINMSRVGIVTTECEGASWASLEFLLCGIPVVSCKSLGGRDVFYTEKNSVVIDIPNGQNGINWYWWAHPEKWCEMLRDAAYQVLSNISKYDSKTISSECLSNCEAHKSIFVSKVLDISNNQLDYEFLINILNNDPDLSAGRKYIQ